MGANSFIVCDANNGSFECNRSLAVVTGSGISLTGSHAAGSTRYTVADTYVNRLLLSEISGSRCSTHETASWEFTVPIISATINGAAFTPITPAYGTDPIVIETEGSANPDVAVTQVRIIGKLNGFCNIAVGQCIAGGSGGSPGVSVLVGQKVVSRANSNIIVGADIF